MKIPGSRCVIPLLVWLAGAAGGGEALRDPELVIPFAKQPPVIDGRLWPDEWRHAAAISMFEAYPSGVPRVMRQEQPVFYLCWDKDHLYVGMDSIDSSTNTIVAACSQHDNMRLIGDDCVEMMLAPGTMEDVKRFDFPTYYIAFNSIGTVWDARFVPLLAEAHNSWESGMKRANSVEGTHWMAEARIPLKNIAKEPAKEGQVWRMNFDRTYSGYHWSAWCAAGGLNDARVGGNVTFATQSPAVRLVATDALADGLLKLRMEVANATDRPQTVKLALKCLGEEAAGKDKSVVGSDEKALTIEPGKVADAPLGRGERLLRLNRVVVEATDEAGKRLFFIERDVQVPSPRLVRRPAPRVPLVYVFPRFLPSLERLAVIVDYTAWAKKTAHAGPPPAAEIKVFRQGEEGGKPVLSGTLKDFAENKGTWRHSTKDLPEGNYTVKVKVTSPNGEVIADHDDWFEKRIFEWMKSPRGVGEAVPTPYTPLAVEGDTVKPWGRAYAFGPNGLPTRIASQGKELLKGAAELSAQIGGKAIVPTVEAPLQFTSAKPGEVRGKSSLKAGDLKIEIDSVTEYDGFTLYRITYRPADKEAAVGRLRVRIPLDARYCKFYSAGGDTQGTNILGDLLPDKQGKVYDSLANTRSVACSPSFATIFWVGDHETCFCYAADSDKGWLIRDDAPAVEAVRDGDTLNLWLNLVDREAKLTEPRTLEFGLQAGPTKPLPDEWRRLQDSGIPSDDLLTIIQVGGGGDPLAGGTHLMHPGDTPELQKKSRDAIEKVIDGQRKAVVGYHYWGTVPKGRPETRVFRGEWGIDKYTWDAATEVRQWEWQNRCYGENQDLYVIMYVRCVPSYVDFLTAAYDECLKHTPISGFYDDTGYPKPVYDEELGLGFVREDGRRVASSGLWVMRERWKRAAYVNFQHGRPNFLRDSQHVNGHMMPGYQFIGLWAPCEHGYYNPFPDRDNLGFYGSLDRYAAFNPAKQFGQVPMIGMSSPQWKAPLFAADTRCMMMLCLLNDHDVGSFGHRDPRIVAKLRHARNIFKPWEKDVRFVGYWESSEFVKASPADIKVSLFRRPGAALLVLGNVGDATVRATIEPNWKALGLDASRVEALNTETAEKLPLPPRGRGEGEGAPSKRGPTLTPPSPWKGEGFRIDVPRHDVRLILLAAPAAYPVSAEKLGAELPQPKRVLKQFSECFDGADVPAGWEKDLHEGNAGVWMLDGRLCVQGAHYGFAHIRRELGVDNISAQCLILRPGTGCMDTSGASLFLVWPNGEYAQATPGTCEGKFVYLLSGVGHHKGSDIGRRAIPGCYPYLPNWVKIALSPEGIAFYGSSDGKSWVKDWEAKRGPKHAGPPQWLILGNGHAGPRPHLDNVIPQHFSPTNPACSFFSDLVVGRE